MNMKTWIDYYIANYGTPPTLSEYIARKLSTDNDSILSDDTQVR